MLPYSDATSDFSGSPVVFASFPQSHFLPRDHIQSPQSQWMPAMDTTVPVATRPPLVSNPSRKRSREEFDDLDPASLSSADNGGSASMEVIEEPILGEGMTLIDPQTGRALAAESQTGTWYEDNLEEERRAAAEAAAALEQEKLDAQGRPTKSVRLDSPAPGASDTAAAQRSTVTPAPAIDSASMMLGIGWKEISSNADLQSAARGWARYIENHYSVLSGVEILCKSDGLEAILVKANQPRESYWLFKEDLGEAKLVAASVEDCVRNMRAQPMVFENDTSLFASSSPSQSMTTPAPPAPAASSVVVAGVADHMMFD